MPLTPEEEKRLREQIRKELEERERRIQESKQREEQSRQRQIEERIRQKIKEEEEERFFQGRGYVKYINHKGEVEWLTPEEVEKRQGRRRTKKTSSRYRKRKKRKIIQWAINGVMVMVALMVFWTLLKYNPIKREKAYGSILVETNVPGAQIYLNGAEKPIFSPDTIPHLAVGKNYFISVYKEGFSSWPPMQRITVKKNEVAVANFQLKHSAKFVRVRLKSNEADFQLFVDGLPFARQGNVVEIPSGYHIITAVKPGYLTDPPYHRLLLDGDDTVELQLRFEQQEEVGYLQVTNNRSTSYIYLNDRITGIKTNRGYFPVKPGVYEVRVRENGFQPLPEVEVVTISPGERRLLTFHMKTESQFDTLQIISQIPGSTIILDGHWLPFVTPAVDIPVSKGDHYINLMLGSQVLHESDLLVDASHLQTKKLELKF